MSKTQDSLSASGLTHYVDHNKLAYLRQSLDETAFKILTGTAAKYIPELEEKEWCIVADSNALCYGFRIVHDSINDKIVQVGVERARYPAFRLRKRTVTSSGNTTGWIRDVAMDLRIPDLAIDDRSYVAIYETETSLQSSMADSSFSQVDVEAAGGGSVFGVSVSASASYGRSESKEKEESSTSTKKRVTIAYNFPRVTVFLDDRSLEMTPSCQAALSEVRDADTMNKFFEDYGQFFSTRVQLGGRLFASEEVDASTKGGSQQTAKQMKAAASVAFSGWGASASVSASGEEQSSTSKSSASSSSAMALTWQANGGDTLLCNDPAAWAPTVAYHWNWRITKQDKVLHLSELMAKFPGFEWLPEKVAAWKVDTSSRPPLAKGKAFTLNEAGFENGRFLTCLYRDEGSVASVANYINELKFLPAIKVKTSHYNIGITVMGPELAYREREDRLFKLETLDGEPVSDVQYRTRYRLMNPARRLYVGYNAECMNILSSSESKGRPLLFRDAENPDKKGSIPDGAKLLVYVFDKPTDEKETGYIVEIYSNFESEYLAVAGKEHTPTKMVLRY
ncbi:hypothetical protein CDD83_1235 [Cordyceps sp. RAO-2017]|nr:hypothetical protein CDD83_1235 [Cordyceps sp. RAO-2017]